MKMSRLKVLSKGEVEQIHNSSVELLERIGIRVLSEEAKDLLVENGANLETRNNNEFVRIPENLIKESLKTVPDRFKLWGPDASFNFEVSTETTQFATVGTPVKIFDPSKKKGVRKTVLTDNIKQIRIVDSLKNIMASHVDIWPTDIPYTEVHCHAMKAWATHSKKPYGLGCLGKLASQDMMNIASTIVGGEEELIKRPRLIGFMNPTSPLMLTKIMLNGMFVFAKYKQPLILAPAASAGSTAPVTLAGLLVQTNMEVLASVVLSQLMNPGTPVFYSTMNAPMDPSTGNVAWGSIETGLITAGAAQLARYYNIPSRGPGAVTESKCFDIQNGFERMMTLYTAAQAGINYITCAGTYESSLAEALELLVIDDELIEILKRGLEGVNVDENSLAVEEIEKIAGTGDNFLGKKHSVKNIRKELIVPKLVDRERRGKWYRAGAKNMIQRAAERVQQILESQVGPGLSPEVESKLDEYTLKVAQRSMDDYEKAEGIEKSDSSAGLSNIDRDKE